MYVIFSQESEFQNDVYVAEFGLQMKIALIKFRCDIAYPNFDRQIANRHSSFQAAMFSYVLVSDEL